MKVRPLDPRRLDVKVFAKDGGRLEADWPLMSLDRLAENAHPDAKPEAADIVHCDAHGESRPVRGGSPEVWLHLAAHARLQLVCQRCLAKVASPIEVRRSFLFVSGEDTASQLDADAQDDVLALTHALDLRELVEDELLLALPLVPRHEECPQPLPLDSGVDLDADERANPFAALATLKQKAQPD